LISSQHQPKKVLIVDDDLTNRIVLRALLKQSGYESIEVENGELAVEAVEKNHIDIILLDVMMPVMDGYQAAKVIKSRGDRFIPIIFLTALTDEEALAKCIEAGGDDFLTKPYNHILLNSKIDSMLRIAGLYQNIEAKNKAIKNHNLQMLQEMNVTKKLFEKISSNDYRGDDTGLHYSMSPMTMFNGDIILAEKNQTGGLDILIGDFTGHGLSAAIGAMPMSDIFYSMTKKGFSFAEILTEANAKLIDLLPTEMFMAAGLISVDRSNNVVSIVNAGLPDIYLYRNNQIVRTFKSKNIPFGINKITAQQIEVEMMPLEYGDRFYVATDGVMEATNKNGEMFGLHRLLKTFKDNTQGSELFNSILSDCADFCEGAAQTDDITLLELCHIENIYYGDDVEFTNEYCDPSNWSMQFSLDIKSLRQFDVLPFIMQVINQLQPLESGRTSLHTVLTEMFTNALDHGVLKLDSSMKSTSQGYMDFYQEKQKRLESLETGNIQILISHELMDDGHSGRLTLVITDSGDGFDFASPETDKNKYSGRGLKLVSSLCTEMKFLGKGNSVMAYYDWSRKES